MNRLVSPLILSLTVAALALAPGCAKHIGDDCSNNTDCSADGDRVCDTSNPSSGYCTIEGCDTGTCPDEATCVRFFPASFLQSTADCRADTTLNNGCAKDQICLTSTGACAPRSTERRFCMLSCAVDQDCRSGYRCVRTGSEGLAGAEAIPKPSDTTQTIKNVRFCAAAPVSQ
jgi:hypothetical protein